MRSAWLLIVPVAAVVAFGMLVWRACDGSAGSVAGWSGQPAPGALEIHYAPVENLERIDVATLDTATRAIDMAAFTLTDQAVIEALARAARRGVTVRILFDRGQLETRPESGPLIALQDVPGVTVRVKRGHVYMHLKAYQIDGRILRTGSANFSASGLKQQDNDLVRLDSATAAARFKADFDAMFAGAASQ